MSQRTRLLTRMGAVIGGILIVLVVAAVLILQSPWFSNFVREKIVATLEESTGGVAEIGSFQFDWSHLTVRIRNFVLHGTEPKGSNPLAQIALLELRLKLFSAFNKPVDLQYLGIESPKVNLVVYPDGKTNVPEPKVKKQSSSNESGLQTVVNLAIGQFRIENGFLGYSQQGTQQNTTFAARGENLRLALDYNTLHPSYQGALRIDPLLINSGTNTSLPVHVNLPITIERDTVRLADARLTTSESQIVINASVQNMKSPQISGQMKLAASVPEMQRAFGLPLDTAAKNSPKILTAEASVRVDSQPSLIEVKAARLALGKSNFEASGSLDRIHSSAVMFNANFALGELASLLKVTDMGAGGDLRAKGTASLNPQGQYAVNGTLNSQDLFVKSGTTRLSDVSLSTPFHADPYLISLDGLKLTALGGSLGAKVFIENLQRLSVEGSLRDFSLPVLTATFTGKQLGFDGTVNGSIKAQGDLKAKGTTGYAASAALAIAPGSRGVPVSGRIYADYVGKTGLVDVKNSYLALPNTRIDLSGSLNYQIDLNLVSHNFNDFLPAANFGSATPQSTLPLSLEGGVALIRAQIRGNLATPQITGHVALDKFAVQQRSFDRLALDLAASPSEAAVRNGQLTRRALQMNFEATAGLRKWSPLPTSPLSANLTLRTGDAADLLSLAGQSSIPATGSVGADVHVTGTYGNPLGSANLQVVNASAYQQPIDHVTLAVSMTDQLITLSALEIASAGGRLNLNGTFQHPRDSFTVGHGQFHLATSNVQLANIRPLQQKSPGAAGLIQLSADLAGNLRPAAGQTQFSVATVNLDLAGRGLRVRNQSAGDLTAYARTAGSNVDYRVASDFAGSSISVKGATSLTKDYPTIADASIQNLAIEKVLQIVGQGSMPARGNLSADAHVSGTLQAPNADLQLALTRANVCQEAINNLQGRLHYTNTVVEVPSLRLSVPAGTVSLSGLFTHAVGDLQNGSLRLKLDSSDIELGKFYHVQQAKPGLAGTLRLAADISSALREKNGNRELLFSQVNADLSANRLRVGSQSLGGAEFIAKSTGQNLNFRLDSDLAKSEIHATGGLQLAGNYPTHADLSFRNIRYSNLAPVITSDPEPPLSYDGLIEGKATFNGSILDTAAAVARLQLDRLEFQNQPRSSPTGAPPTRAVSFHNEGPIVIALDHSAVRVQHLQIVGPKTTISASGGMDLKETRSPLTLNLAANADLGVLQDLDRDFYSSGALTLDAVVHGNLSQPLVNGQVELKNANVNYADSPNGLSNANGVILLNGTNATIQNLTGESGGGKISMAGFVGYTGRSANFNLRATANKVRVRYSGISVTSNAEISLIGNTRRSLASGNLSIQRIAYSSSSDAGSFLSNASTPPSTPSAPSPVLAGMRLDIRILTAPDLRVVTTYADRLSIEANLSVRGTAATPGMLGRATVTDGQLVFFGNQYTVNTGTINFYSPNAIQPVLNFSLETVAQNVDVVLGVSGTMNNLQLSYRSDPPLTFTQIVQLLATNTTPNDPTIAAHQPTPPQQSLGQMGASAVLGQAIANPLASRVQRVFGISSLKIDPSVAGTNGQPTAKVTLQQRIANNIMFTYITDVTQTNSQILRVEWSVTPRFSAMTLRDYNGNVSVQVFYKFKVR